MSPLKVEVGNKSGNLLVTQIYDQSPFRIKNIRENGIVDKYAVGIHPDGTSAYVNEFRGDEHPLFRYIDPVEKVASETIAILQYGQAFALDVHPVDPEHLVHLIFSFFSEDDLCK